MAAFARLDWPERALYAIAGGCFLLSLYARIVPAWHVVFRAPGDVRLLDADSYYHLRHTAFAVEHFPHVQRWDVGTNFPLGERSPHAGLFHVFLAGLCLMLGGPHAGQALEAAVLAWAPIGLYGLASVLLFLLARSLRDTRMAAFAIAVWSLFPGLSFARTLLGFADHHAAEMVLTLATLLGLKAALSSPSHSLLRRVSYVLPLLAFQFTWSGAPLVIALIGGSVTVAAASDLMRDGSCVDSARVAIEWGAALALGLLVVRSIAPNAIMIERLFVPSVASSVALAVLGLLATRLAPASRRERWNTVAGLLIVAFAAAGATVWRLPSDFVSLLLEPKTAVVQEQRGVSALQFLSLQGCFGVIACLSVPVCWLGAVRSASFRAPLACAVFATAVLAGWLLSHDYSYLPPPLLALASGLVVSTWATLRGRGQPRWSLAAALAVGAVQIWPFRAAPNPFSAEPTRLLQIDGAWIAAMHWLRDSTPTPKPSVSANVPGWPRGRFAYGSDSYGVLSAWDFGNLVSALGRRVPVRSHGFSRQISEWLVSPDEASSLEWLCPLCGKDQLVRYVVLSAPTLAEHFVVNWGQTRLAGAERTATLGVLEHNGRTIPLLGYGSVYDRSIGVRLYANDANGLEHYRLVYQSEEPAATERSAFGPKEGRDVALMSTSDVATALAVAAATPDRV